jgi:RimJ/RimL family protein N-acetyltransferase
VTSSAGRGFDPVELSDGVVRLRPWRPDDADAVYRACQDPLIARWTRVPSPYTRAHAAEFVAASPGAWAAGRPAFAVVEAATGQVVGAHGFVSGIEEGVAEIGYWTAPWGRGRGLTTAATRLLARWAFQRAGVARLDWYAEAGNVASLRVAESSGFRFEGVAPHKLQQRGVQVDAWMAGLLPQWVDAPRPPSRLPWVPQAVLGDAVVLREFRDDDLAALRAALDDPDIRRWNPHRWAGPDPAPAVLAAGRDWSGGTNAAWLVCTPSDDSLRGLVAVHSISEFQGTAEIGYWIVAPARGHGLATAAVTQATTWAFVTVGLRRIDLLHATDNPASCRVALKAGFAAEGTQRASFVYGDDRPHDEHRHARLASDPAP